MRVFFGAVVGAIVVFVWGWVAWAGIDLYGFAIKGMPNEEIAVPALQANLPESGAYYFPAMPGDMKDKAAMDAYAAKHQAGPIGMVLFRKQGAPPMHWSVMARGYAMYLAAALVMAAMMNALRLKTTAFRLGFVMLMAGFAMLMLLMVTVIYNDLTRVEWLRRLLG